MFERKKIIFPDDFKQNFVLKQLFEIGPWRAYNPKLLKLALRGQSNTILSKSFHFPINTPGFVTKNVPQTSSKTRLYF